MMVLNIDISYNFLNLNILIIQNIWFFALKFGFETLVLIFGVKFLSSRDRTFLSDEMQPDYKASVDDHGAIRIAICKVKGQNNSKLYERIRQKIEKHRELNVSGRKLRMKYV